MKRIVGIVVGCLVGSSLWAANLGTVTLYGGYNNWVRGQFLLSSLEEEGITNANAKTDGGGWSFGGEILAGHPQKTQFGVEIAWQPLLTVSGTDPTTGEKKSVGFVQTPIIGKVVFQNAWGIYGSLGLGISFISAFGDKELQNVMKLAFKDPALTTKFGFGLKRPITSWLGFDVGVNTTIALGDYGLTQGQSPIWFNMIFFWQVGFQAGLSLYF
ncbi:hypothetical protein [Thermospira aquatica]|uniref:Outer membrane protein beta-barrel domain-containing protein n=1 Tax=Thermospira aquatica TaxID=2828656 RepID=A0AAX3BDK7_9SPIR|nr:hypothetical protein [Thermospira aquatica]URA10409.1 hypothetical protein KDW03_00980 [Thermospira aquatica]